MDLELLSIAPQLKSAFIRNIGIYQIVEMVSAHRFYYRDVGSDYLDHLNSCERQLWMGLDVHLINEKIQYENILELEFDLSYRFNDWDRAVADFVKNGPKNYGT